MSPRISVNKNGGIYEKGNPLSPDKEAIMHSAYTWLKQNQMGKPVRSPKLAALARVDPKTAMKFIRKQEPSRPRKVRRSQQAAFPSSSVTGGATKQGDSPFEPARSPTAPTKGQEAFSNPCLFEETAEQGKGLDERGADHDPAVVRAYESLFSGPAATTGGRPPRLSSNMRADDLVLYVLYRGERDRARIEADVSAKIRANIEEVEREFERSEARVREAKARKLAEVDRDAERRLRNDPSVVRAYESLLLDRSRIEADARAEMRAKLEELERERDGSESRIRRAAMKKLADVDQDAKRKIRDVCAAFGMLPPPST